MHNCYHLLSDHHDLIIRHRDHNFYFIFHPDSLANYHNRALVTSSFLNYIIIMIIIIVWIKLLTILPGVQRDNVLPLLLFLRPAAACQLYQPFLLLYSFCFLIFSNADALIVITVYLRDITKSSPVHSNILLRNSSTHPNSVLTFRNNISRHTC